METTKKLLLATVIASMFATNGFAMQENNQPKTEQEEKGFYEEHKTAILSAAAILSTVAVITGGYFGYQYFGKDLCAKLFSKAAPKGVETKKAVTPAKKIYFEKTRKFVNNSVNNTIYFMKHPVKQTKKGAEYGWNGFTNFVKSSWTLITTDSDKTAQKPAPAK